MVEKRTIRVKKKDQLNYVIRHVHLTEDQLKQIAEGFSRKKCVKLSVSLIRNKDSAQNEQKLPLTRYQIKKLIKVKKLHYQSNSWNTLIKKEDSYLQYLL